MQRFEIEQLQQHEGSSRSSTLHHVPQQRQIYSQTTTTKDDGDSRRQYRQEHLDRPSNENLLGTAFVTFMGFAMIQTVVAYFAKSEAMLGDSAAMVVDAMTYLFNWCAERKKAQLIVNDDDDDDDDGDNYEDFVDRIGGEKRISNNDNDGDNDDKERRQRIVARTKRKKVLQLELTPPLISVSTLIVVTIVVLRQSIRVLVLDAHRSISKQGNPNIRIMMYFSIANLALDLINVANFAKAKHLFGYETNNHLHDQGHAALASVSDDDDNDDTNNHDNKNDTHDKGEGQFQQRPLPRLKIKHNNSVRAKEEYNDDDDDDEGDQDSEANLNMCSAYTVSWWCCCL